MSSDLLQKRDEGTVAEVKEKGEVSVTSDKGNTITRIGEPGSPAVRVAREGNDVAKKAHELTVESKSNQDASNDKGPKSDEAQANGQPKKADAEVKDVEDSEKSKDNQEKTNEDSKVGEKRERAEEDTAATTKDEAQKENGAPLNGQETQEKDLAADDEPSVKKPKTGADAEDDEASKKSRGRPKKADTNGTKPASTRKQRERKPAATADGKPRRSARLSS